MTTTMRGVFLPGDSTAEVREYPVPTPGPGQVVIEMGASGICGSDIGYIYRGYKTHKGLDGAPAYRGVIAGHEPCGRIVEVGAGCVRFGDGDAVIVYHIRGCGQCANCRAGYQISCRDGSRRKAYGWQRDGGHSDYVLVDEASCIPLPAALSYVDGALIACGFGTAYEGVIRAGSCGGEDVSVVGLGPVGLATALIARRLGANRIVGIERSPERIAFAESLGVFDSIFTADDTVVERVLEATTGRGTAVAIDASGSAPGRSTALEVASEWGRVGLIGEGGRLETEVSDTLLHKQLTLSASWVTSLQGMEKVAQLFADSPVHPEVVVSDVLPLADADDAYRLAAGGAGGKVVLVRDLGSNT